MKRQSKSWVYLGACGLLVGLLAGCTSSPERAVVAKVLEVESRFHPDLRAGMIDILQAREWYDGHMILIRYPMGKGNEVDECYGLYRAERSGGQWQVKGWATCKEEHGPDKPFGLHVQPGQTSESGTWSEVHGRVYAEGVTAIQVLWDDGETQDAAVIRRSYLALRDGAHEVTRVRGLDAGGEALSTMEPAVRK